MDYTDYNNLPSLEDADGGFTNDDRARLFPDLIRLFSQEAYAGVYAFGLVHRHFELERGERMVTTAKIPHEEYITRPEKFPDNTIIADRWTANGQAFEFSRLHAGQEAVPPPPQQLLATFRELIGSRLERFLGIYLSPNHPDGQIYLDGPFNSEDREQIILVQDSCSCSIYGAVSVCWAPREGDSDTCAACKVCIETDPNHKKIDTVRSMCRHSISYGLSDPDSCPLQNPRARSKEVFK
ncbi:hypothetical protein FA15DRAFT_592324 [Coprinopsis marcescibilis]|uniref:Uncharacterized protein n=1 Tax=Coprinopsis marcescibilis TaxID=230819 RepID=A0A5C3KVC3_COPMA|nr:hypothetical protein FA15DRAFT_592324 [Coprinopsis marcescibilis]